METPGTFRVMLPDRVHWEPKEDITAHELALAMPVLFRIQSGDWNWNYPQHLMPTLPDGVRRHFRLEPRSN
jgi:hypothetical protein